MNPNPIPIPNPHPTFTGPPAAAPASSAGALPPSSVPFQASITTPTANSMSSPQPAKLIESVKSPLHPERMPLKASLRRLQSALSDAPQSSIAEDPISQGFLSNPSLSVPFNQTESDPQSLCLLLGLCDDFIDDVLSYACTLAKHRSSQVLQACDIRAALEQKYNLTLPGVATVGKPPVAPSSKETPLPPSSLNIPSNSRSLIYGIGNAQRRRLALIDRVKDHESQTAFQSDLEAPPAKRQA